MPIYMKFTKSDGHDIKGDAAAPYEGWIELNSVQFGTPHRGTGGAQNRPASPTPSVKDILVTKDQDSASPELFNQSVWGEAAKVQIDFVQSEGGKSTVYLSFTLEGTVVSSYQLSGARGDSSTGIETLTLTFEKISYDTKKAGRLVPGGKIVPGGSTGP
jgi:type VI protein secretion system component Hcp